MSYFYWLTLDYTEDSPHPQTAAGLLQLTLHILTRNKDFVPVSDWPPAFPKSALITARQHYVPAGGAFDMSYTLAGLLFARKTSSLQFLHFPRCSKSHQGHATAMQPTLQQRLEHSGSQDLSYVLPPPSASGILGSRAPPPPALSSDLRRGLARMTHLSEHPGQ